MCPAPSATIGPAGGMLTWRDGVVERPVLLRWRQCCSRRQSVPCVRSARTHYQSLIESLQDARSATPWSTATPPPRSALYLAGWVPTLRVQPSTRAAAEVRDIEARTPEKYGNDPSTSRASDPAVASRTCSATADADSAASLQTGGPGLDSRRRRRCLAVLCRIDLSMDQGAPSAR